MKNIIAIITACVLLSSFGTERSEKIDGYTYTYNQEYVSSSSGYKYELKKYDGGCAVSPKPIGDFSIGMWFATSIGTGAFDGCDRMTSISIPGSVSSIYAGAFSGCVALTQVVFSAGSKFSGSLAVFSGCNLIKEFVIDGEYCQSVNGVVFSKDMSTLIKYPPASDRESYVIPETVTDISESAFESATNLVEIVIPQGVTFIGRSAFRGCSKLAEISLPAAITTVPEYCFVGCSSMTSAVVNCYSVNVGCEAFRDCANLEYFNLTNSATIARLAFAGSGLKSVYTRANTIEEEAFSNCVHLTDIEINQINIPRHTFSGCIALKNFSQMASGGSYYVSDWAFKDCKSIKRLVFNDGMTGCGQGAFSGCASLEEITMPLVGENATSSGYPGSTFCATFGPLPYEGSYLVKPLYIKSDFYSTCATTNFYVPISLRRVTITQATQLPLSAFEGCYTIASIKLPDTLTTIRQRAFFDCWGLKSIEIPSSVSTIGAGYFTNNSIKYDGRAFGGNCSVQDVALPGNLSAISNVFASCEYITNIVISTGTEEISTGFCEGCVGVKSLMVPVSVQIIGDKAFRNCKALESVVYLGDAPSLGGNNIYVGTPESLVSYVMEGSCGWNGDPISAELPKSWPTSITGARAIDHYIDPALQVVAPVISPTSSDYLNPYQEVSIACDDDSAVIYYTTDGTEPSSHSMEYSGPFVVYRTTIVKAVAVKRGYYPSKISQSMLRKSDELSEAGNLYSATFDNDASSPWVKDEEMSHDGISSIRSGAIDKNGVTEVVTSIKKSGTISFWWRTKCEEPDVEDGEDGYYDFATFFVDGTEIARIAGEDSGWKFVKHTIASGGKHELKWRYQKDGLTTYAPDCVWVDQIQWEPSDGSGSTYSTPIKVPFSWLREKGYDESNFEIEANRKTGKIGSRGNEMEVWCDYLQGTDPYNQNDMFTASIEMIDGKPHLDWYPYLNTNGMVRTYRIKGKEELLDDKWVWPADSSVHRFFRIDVAPYDSTVGSDEPGVVTPKP